MKTKKPYYFIKMDKYNSYFRIVLMIASLSRGLTKLVGTNFMIFIKKFAKIVYNTMLYLIFQYCWDLAPIQGILIGSEAILEIFSKIKVILEKCFNSYYCKKKFILKKRHWRHFRVITIVVIRLFYDRQNSGYDMQTREGGDIGLFITLAPKVL